MSNKFRDWVLLGNKQELAGRFRMRYKFKAEGDTSSKLKVIQVQNYCYRYYYFTDHHPQTPRGSVGSVHHHLDIFIKLLI